MDGSIARPNEAALPQGAGRTSRMSAALSPENLLAGLRRAAVPIAICAFAGSLAAYFYASGLEKSYTASALLAVEGDRMAIPELQGALRSDNNPDPMPLVHTEVQALSARQLVQSVAVHLHLERDPEFNAALRKPGAVAAARAWLKSWFPAGAGTPASPAAADDMLINAVSHALVISQDNRSLVIGIAFTAHDPALAARVVNTLIATYIDARAQRRSTADASASAVMSQRIEQVRSDIATIEQRMRTLRNASGMVALRAGSLGQQQVEDLATAASRATLDRSEAEANWERASAVSSGGSSDALASVLGSETISRLREQEAQASARVADLSQRFGSAYPALRSAQADLAAARTQLAQETHRIVASLATQLKVARAHEADVLAQLAAARRSGVAAQNTQAELDQMQQDATTRRQLYRTLLEQAQQTASQPQASQTPDVRVLSEAAPPGLPSAPNVKAAAGLGGVAGGLVAWSVSLAFIRQDGPAGGEDFAHRLGLGVAARIRRKRGQDLASRVVRDDGGREADAMRQLRLSMERMSRVPPRVVCFVGAQPGSLAASAACAYGRVAALDRRHVLLIDLDLSGKPTKRALPAPEGKPDDMLSGDGDWHDIVRPDTVRGLDVAVGGARSHGAAFSSTVALENLLVEMRGEYDIVVLGAPDAAQANAAAILRSSDAAVLVIDERHAAARGTLAASSALRAGARLPMTTLLLEG